MKLQVEWGRPIRLSSGKARGMIYDVDLERVVTDAGVYVFGRTWGRQFEALYVGKATKIRQRINGQLNNLRLMQHLLHAKSGDRIVIAGAPGSRRLLALTWDEEHSHRPASGSRLPISCRPFRFDLDDSDFAQCVVTKTAPPPVSRLFDQTTLYRIAMQIA